MGHQQRTFLAGMALGAALGLVLGQVPSWKSASTPLPDSNPIASKGPLDIAGNNADRMVLLPSESRSFGIGFPDSSPESAPPQLLNATAIRNSRPVRNIEPTQLAQILEEPDPIPLAEANPLPGPPAAKGTDPETLQRIIDNELDDVPAAQREIWFEALRDVEPKDVPDILRMWKMLGGPSSPGGLPSGQLAPAPKQPRALPPPKISELAAASQRIRQRNIEQSETPGAVHWTPVWMEAITEAGLRPAGVLPRPDFSGRLVSTGLDLDLSVNGPGFFVLKDSQGERFFIRSGRFSLDDQRRIVLELAGRSLILQPEMRLPQDNGPVTIDAAGQVVAACGHCSEPERLGTVQLAELLTTVHLQDRGNGLFQLAEQHLAELLLTRPGESEQTGTIVQGSLLFPDVNVNAEREAIEQLKTLRAD